MNVPPFVASLAVVVLLSGAGVADAQPRGGGPRSRAGLGPAGDDAAAGVTPGEVQKMFDAYALMQAQEQLKINDEQFTRFLTRFKALQEIRRQALQERAGIIMALRRLVNAAQADQAATEAKIKERMLALQDLETRSAADVKKAYDGIDQVLDIKQQAQFRVFEETMERRKLELVMRARQGNRPR